MGIECDSYILLHHSVGLLVATTSFITYSYDMALQIITNSTRASNRPLQPCATHLSLRLLRVSPEWADAVRQLRADPRLWRDLEEELADRHGCRKSVNYRTC